VNAIEPFRYRIINDEVYVFDQIDVSATILRDDKTFGFSYMNYAENIHEFAEIVAIEIERIQNTEGLFTRLFPENLIHFSALPWINFDSFSHARSFTFPDSCPKISFGKMMDDHGKNHVHVGSCAPRTIGWIPCG